MIKVVNTELAPQAIGPYSQAVIANGFVFVSGQIALSAEGFLLEDGVKEQTHQVMKNLGAVLAAAGSGFEKVVKTTIFLASMDDFAIVNQVYSEYFEGENRPARATVEVSRLPKDVAVEIEVVAVV